MVMRTLIVDEPGARDRLRLLARAHDDVEIMGECGTAAEALAAMELDLPDLLLLDVDLPEGDGFTVVEALSTRPRPAVVIVTASAEHALRAFDVQATDYLLKPYSGRRLDVALQRARDHVGRAGSRSGAPPPRGLRRLPVEVGGRIVLVDLCDVDYLRAEGNYVRIHVGARTFLVRDTLAGMARRLDTGEFLRIHRSVVVRLDRIREVETRHHGELALRLCDGTRLVSGRSYGPRLRAALVLPG
jgi:two-component system, LytTR family, response regulator